MDGLQRKDGEFASLVAQVEEGQRGYAENVHRLDVVNDLIAKRRAREREFEGEEGFESEQDDDQSDQDEDESESKQDDNKSEREEHEGEQNIRVKLDYLKIH
jgi:hypothetical protein